MKQILIQPKGDGFVVIFDEIEYPTCKDGYLLNFKDWNVHWQDSMFHALGIEYVDEHGVVIGCLQRIYKRDGMAPMFSILAKSAEIPQNRIITIFGGKSSNALKIAGLPSPH